MSLYFSCNLRGCDAFILENTLELKFMKRKNKFVNTDLKTKKSLYVQTLQQKNEKSLYIQTLQTKKMKKTKKRYQSGGYSIFSQQKVLVAKNNCCFESGLRSE
jgi:hypothetical protein